MPAVVTAAERASFTRCRRQWDFGARGRQNLEPCQRPPNPEARQGPADFNRAIRYALAVYYFPGMWDWDSAVRLPLVGQELDRALARQGQEVGRAEGQALLDGYIRWAPTVDRFAPVLVETDFEVTVLGRDGAAVTAGGEPVRYTGRIDLMAVDQHDAYWIVRHRVVEGDWPATEDLVADEEALAACWAWKQFYLGMGITGTVYNELRRPPSPGPARRPRRAWLRRHLPRVRQHEPSGGGRSIPQHRRMYARAREPARAEAIEQRIYDGFRRTWLRRAPEDITAAGRRLGADIAEMVRPDLAVYPEPSDRHCPPCPYLEPCLALREGRHPAVGLPPAAAGRPGGRPPRRPVLGHGPRRRPAEIPRRWPLAPARVRPAWPP
jgi:hypothetical protein